MCYSLVGRNGLESATPPPPCWGLMMLMSIPGRFLFGWLGDRFNKKVLLFLLCLLQGAGIFIFIHANTLEMLYLFVVIYGLGYVGVIPLTIALRADLFGRRNLAIILNSFYTYRRSFTMSRFRRLHTRLIFHPFNNCSCSLSSPNTGSCQAESSPLYI